jgi:hypothetical protein
VENVPISLFHKSMETSKKFWEIAATFACFTFRQTAKTLVIPKPEGSLHGPKSVQNFLRNKVA